MTARITIGNIAGGDARTFPWRGELSDRAIRHADRCDNAVGGVMFWSADGKAASDAADRYERIREDRELAA